MKRAQLLGFVSTVGLAVYGAGLPARAQTTRAVAHPPSAGLAEVIVTAQRRSQNLQKTSLAIQVLSAADLAKQGIVEAKDLMRAVPGLAIGSGGPQTQIYIRGVGDLSAVAISNPAVATNIDGIYIARPTAVNANFFDLARVEVLKGPQGTLYGRNASGGALNIITAQPALGRQNGYEDFEIGNYDNIINDGAINLPVTDSIAVRGAYQIVNRNGYLSDGFDDDKHQSVRLQALYKPNDETSLTLGVDYSHMGGKGGGFVYRPFPSGTNPWEGDTSAASNAVLEKAAAAAGLCAPAHAFPAAADAKASQGACPAGLISLFNPLDGAGVHQDNDLGGVRADFEQNLGFATLSILPAYRFTRESYTTFPAYPFYQNPASSQETTLEARLSKDTERVKWVAGVYLYNEDQHYTSGVSAGMVQNVQYQVAAHTKSVAAFGQTTVRVTDDTRLIGGLRYTIDERNLNGGADSLFPALSQTNPSAICLDPAVASCTEENFSGQHNFYSLSWKAGVEHDLTPQSMLYFTASTGFKAGGLNQNVTSAFGSTRATVYYPEKLLAFELGSRNRFLDNRLQVNLEAFYWDYRDHQEPHVIIDGQGNSAFGFVNAGEAAMYGLDPDVRFSLTPYDTFHVLGEFIQSKYDSFKYTSAFASNSSCRQTLSGGLYTVDCSGNQMAHVSKWSGSASYDHNFDLADGAQITASVDAQFASAQWLQVDFTPAERAPGVVTEDASLTYSSASGVWTLSGYVRNLSNKAVYASGNANAFGPELFAASIGAPRTFGAKLHVGF